MSLGPVGGSGGRGGSVYVEGTSDLSALNNFQHKKLFEAEDGLYGRDQFRDGYDGKDLVLKVPTGTVIYNLTTGEDREITQIGELLLLARGGLGGKGNFHFRSSTNTSPKEFQPGLPGQDFEYRFELKLIADIGFIGFPNVGKSSLLNELTKAQSKVAHYPFTTLEPNLGVYYELILADIPGLIEGSSTGKGLGTKFLRHIERTKILFHFVSAESDDPIKDYKAIRKELGLFNKTLLKKPEYLFLSKSDMVSPAEIKKKISALKKVYPVRDKTPSASVLSSSRTSNGAIAISILDDKSIESVKKILNAIKKEKITKK